MLSLIEKLSDRMLAMVVPRAEAEAANCDYSPCQWKFCYCYGSRWYRKLCCRTGTGSSCCNPCKSQGQGCPY
jgi:hypothetical protein